MSFYQIYAYEASAGSGKTFALVVRYISLLYLGAKADNILALTFTNKAANEMRDRVIALLKELDLPKREAELHEIARITNLSKDEIVVKKEALLKSFLEANIAISTIDKFFSKILRKFSLHLGMMPDFSIDERKDEEKFLVRFLSLVKKEELYQKLVEFSIFEDKKISSIFEILDRFYDKDSELIDISFKRGDIYAVESKILSLCSDLKELFCANEKFSQAGRKNLQIDSIEELAKKSWLCRDDMNYWVFKKFHEPKADEILHQIKRDLKLYYTLKDSSIKENYFKLFELYKRAKYDEILSLNQLSFSDISFFVYKLLRGEIDSSFLYFRLDTKIDHLLIDEFQDTNILQFRILEPIIDEIASGVGVKEFRSFFYVGDVKQSIYRFRGGAKELFYQVAKKYGVKVDKLVYNYRSRANIVNFVNDIFRQKIENYTDQLPLQDKLGGYVEVKEGVESLELVVKSVFELIEQGVSEDDIAILTYANSDGFEIKERLLELRSDLRITTQNSIKLINDEMVKSVIEFLKYLYFGDELFLKNFLSLIGEDFEKEIEKESFELKKPLPVLIKEIIVYFDLYYEDENLLKLINISHSYQDIEEFLFESEELNEEAPSQKGNGIKILTIHKSKGLEFEHLIVADRFRKKSQERSSTLFSYKEDGLDDIYIKFTNRECVDREYEEAKERNKELEKEDELNLLYVAFTRAKESLIICKKEKNSAFEPICLEPMKSGEIEVKKRVCEVVTKESDFEYEPIRVGLQEKKRELESEEKSDISAINFGLALHYMLEILDDFNKNDLHRAYWAMKNRYEMMLKDGDCEKIKQRVLNLLEYKPFLELIDGEIYKEQMISFEESIKQLDLLIQKEDHFIIIDYKSSNIVRSEHKAQVLSYKKAISTITNKKVESYLCYLREDGVEIVEVS